MSDLTPLQLKQMVDHHIKNGSLVMWAIHQDRHLKGIRNEAPGKCVKCGSEAGWNTMREIHERTPGNSNNVQAIYGYVIVMHCLECEPQTAPEHLAQHLVPEKIEPQGRLNPNFIAQREALDELTT